MRIHATYAMFLIGLLTAACTPTLVNYEPRVHVVQSGETLMYISWRHHVDFRDLARWNDLDNPDLILVGQRLFITAPESVQQGAGTPTQASPSPARSSGDARPPPASTPQARTGQASPAQTRSSPAPVAPAGPPASSAQAPVPSPSGSGQPAASAATPVAGRPLPSLPVLPAPPWQWPVRGPVVSPFGASEGTGGGIGIGGTLGADIKATAAGQVVYAGGGLAAYGNLVILKHNDTYLSAYGHNDALVVSEGDTVSQGQVIAKMGLGPERQAQVHFEIRRNGTPVDPLGLLPK